MNEVISLQQNNEAPDSHKIDNEASLRMAKA